MIRTLRATILVVVALVATIVTSAPAHATAVLSCTGTQTVTYSPGLTNTPQTLTVTISETYSYCPLGGVQTGSASFTVTEQASCVATAEVVQDNVVYTWQVNGSQQVTSTVNFTQTAVIWAVTGTTQVTAIGSVTAGFGNQSLATRTSTLPQLNPLQCLSSTGVTSATGPATLTFL